jgi:hypothetical protein
MRFSIAVAAVLGGLQAVSALKLSPRNAVEREEQVRISFCAWHGRCCGVSLHFVPRPVLQFLLQNA